MGRGYRHHKAEPGTCPTSQRVQARWYRCHLAEGKSATSQRVYTQPVKGYRSCRAKGACPTGERVQVMSGQGCMPNQAGGIGHVRLRVHAQQVRRYRCYRSESICVTCFVKFIYTALLKADPLNLTCTHTSKICWSVSSRRHSLSVLGQN